MMHVCMVVGHFGLSVAIRLTSTSWASLACSIGHSIVPEKPCGYVEIMIAFYKVFGICLCDSLEDNTDNMRICMI